MKPRTQLGLGLGALALALLARRFVFGLVTVHTASMEPGVLEGSTLFFSRLSEPAPGDIVALSLPDDPGVLHVKRVVAVGPGEVELVEGRLYVDGERVAGQEQELTWTTSDCRQKTVTGIEERGVVVEKAGSLGRTTLLSDEVFLLGDRRATSEDGRQWGPVRKELVEGVVLGVAWARRSCDP